MQPQSILSIAAVLCMLLGGWQYDECIRKERHAETICDINTCKITGIGHCYNSNCYEILVTYTFNTSDVLYTKTDMINIQGDQLCAYNTTKCYYRTYDPQETLSLIELTLPINIVPAVAFTGAAIFLIVMKLIHSSSVG